MTNQSFLIDERDRQVLACELIEFGCNICVTQCSPLSIVIKGNNLSWRTNYVLEQTKTWKSYSDERRSCPDSKKLESFIHSGWSHFYLHRPYRTGMNYFVLVKFLIRFTKRISLTIRKEIHCRCLWLFNEKIGNEKCGSDNNAKTPRSSQLACMHDTSQLGDTC